MISARYAPAICVLLALTLIPTIIHSYARDAFDDGRRAEQVPAGLAGHTAAPSDRHPTWGERRFDSRDWVERHYRSDAGKSVTLTVIRTLDAKRVYHHPELAVAYGTTFVDDTVRRFPARPDIPVHVLTPGPGVTAAGAYVLHYDTRFIDNPIAFQIRTAGELLFSPRKPMTLFFVLDPEADPAKDLDGSSAMAVLFAAIDAFTTP